MAIILDGTTGITTPGLINTGSETVVNLTTTGTTTLGDASGDALTINSSAVSIPNGLNFDSNTLVIDATNNRIAVNGSDSSVGGGQMVVNQANNNGLVINQTGSGNGASIYLRNNTDTTINNFNFTNSGVRFFDVGTATERMRIDSSGNVGIGTSSPTFTGGSGLEIERSGTTATLELTRSDASIAGSLSVQGGSIQNNIYSVGAKPLVLYTNSSERMRIDSSGNLLVGTTSLATPGGAPGKMEVKANAGAGFQWASVFNNATTTSASVIGVSITYTGAAPNGTGNEFLYCIDTSAVRATIRSNGGIANYSANNVNISDAREKTNVELAGSYLDKICAIPVKTFNYIDQNRDEDDGLTLGVIAQDVEAVAPELVMESNWGSIEEPKMRLSIYQTDLQYALMKCIQEQQAIITDLKARLEVLESK